MLPFPERSQQLNTRELRFETFLKFSFLYNFRKAEQAESFKNNKEEKNRSLNNKKTSQGSCESVAFLKSTYVTKDVGLVPDQFFLS